jgi:hypothetical protein
VDRFDKGDGIFGRGLGYDAVAKVEDVAGTTGGLVEDIFGTAADFGFVGEENKRIEVALDGAAFADGLPGVIESDAPIDPDYLAAGFC